MPKCTLSFLFAIFSISSSFSQLSDIISVKKKNGRTVRTLGAGSPISFITPDGFPVEGYISIVRDDSVFVTSHDIRSFPTRWGVSVVDTFATYVDAYHFRDIARIKLREKKFSQVSIPRLLMIGGGAYLLLNVVNSRYLDQPFGEPENLRTLAISAGAFALGFAMQRLQQKKEYSGRRYRFEYIRLR